MFGLFGRSTPKNNNTRNKSMNNNTRNKPMNKPMNNNINDANTNNCIYNTRFIDDVLLYIRGQILGEIDGYFAKEMTDSHDVISVKKVMMMKSSIMEEYSLIKKLNVASNSINSTLTNKVNKALNNIYINVGNISKFAEIPSVTLTKVKRDIEDMKATYCSTHRNTSNNANINNNNTDNCIYNKRFIDDVSSYIRGPILDEIDSYFAKEMLDSRNVSSLQKVMMMKSSIMEEHKLIKNLNVASNSANSITNKVNKALNNIYINIENISKFAEIPRVSLSKVKKDIEDMKDTYCSTHRKYDGGKRTRKNRKTRRR